MFRIIGFCFVMIVFVCGHSQVQANDTLYHFFNRHNQVDSMLVFQSFKWKGNEYELVGNEKLDPFLFEISSKGGLINITTKHTNEDFFYKGEIKEFMAIRLDSNENVYPLKIKAHLYDKSDQKSKSYFYFLPDQKDRIYRIVEFGKKADILLYFIRPKD